MSNSLDHGTKFNKYKSKLYKNDIEGFLVPPSKAVLEETDITRTQNERDALQQEYQNTLGQYDKLRAQVTGNTENYLKRVNPENPYLNKTVRFSTGQNAYVTNQGVVKLIPSDEIGKSVGVPPSSINLGAPWDDSYAIPGTPIPTMPPLISGSALQKGQSIGYEGQNVYVDKLITNSTATYLGCYEDTNTLTFVGDEPPVVSLIHNGEFSHPVIGNNKHHTISNSSSVPGWTFYAKLINNSKDWGYPIPYPVGNQCVSIQTTDNISQTLQNLVVGSYSLTFYACGRDCCDKSGKGNPINVLLNDSSFYTVEPPVNVWTRYTTQFSVTLAGSNTLSFKGTWTSGDRSSALQGISIGLTTSSTGGSYTHEMCKQRAIDDGHSFFALQDVNTETGKGYCSVTDDMIGATKNGSSYAVSGVTGLWSSATSGQSGNSARLNSAGSLEVINSSGTVVYSTPSVNPTNYMGCYKDAKSRAIPLYNKGSQGYNKESCRQLAEDSGNTYYGTQNSSNGEKAQCSFSNDLGHVTMYGKADNCYKLSDGSWSGGPWSNAVYTADPEQKNNYFLILQDDGNMCIYRGASPTDNQGIVWSSNTVGKQKEANPQYSSGKFGKNWITVGETLASGDFIVSSNGKIFLIMNSDGNLVLYTSVKALNCKRMDRNIIGGGQGANALYSLDQTGFKTELSTLSYIGPNSEMYSYPSSEMELAETYSQITGYDSAGNDLISFGGATIDSCKAKCNETQDCYGFVYNNSTQTCYTKDKNMYPNTQKQMIPTAELYVRTRRPKNQPPSISTVVNSVDSLKHHNYISSGKDIRSAYNLNKPNDLQQQELDQLRGKLDLLSKQMIDMTSNLKKKGGLVGSRIQTNTQTVEGFTNGVQGGYLTQLNNTNKRINEYTTNLDHIVDDSQTVFLQHNYEYLLWSAIALGTGIMALSIIRN